jgi:hypothetical protein
MKTGTGSYSNRTVLCRQYTELHSLKFIGLDDCYTEMEGRHHYFSKDLW